MGVRTLLTSVRRDVNSVAYELWEEADGSVKQYIGGVPVIGSSMVPNGVASMRMAGGNTSGVYGTYTTVQQSMCSNRAFYAVRIGIANYSTTVPLSITNMKVAASPTLTNNGAALTWKQVTWNGGSLTASIAAASGSANNIVPTVLYSDIVLVTSVARTDIPADPYLLYVRSYDPSLQIMGGGPALATTSIGVNAAAWVSDKGYTFLSGANATDQVTSTTTGIAMSASFPVNCLAEVEFYTASKDSYPLHCFGDSLLAGWSGNAVGYTSGWCNRLMYRMRAANKINGIANWGVGGMTQSNYIATMKNVVNAYLPKAVYFSPYSPNSGSTQAQIDLQFGATVEAIEWLQNKGVKKIIISTAMPGRDTASPDAPRINFNEMLKSAFSDTCEVWDFASVVCDPSATYRLLPSYAYDTVHVNDLGYEALTAYVAPKLDLTY